MTMKVIITVWAGIPGLTWQSVTANTPNFLKDTILKGGYSFFLKGLIFLVYTCSSAYYWLPLDICVLFAAKQSQTFIESVGLQGIN